MNASTIILQAQQGSALPQIFLLVAILLIFYFVLILPQRREQKRHQEMVDSLKKGDEVLMSGGLIGEIVHLDDDRLTIKTGDTRVVVNRGRAMKVLNAPEARGR